MVYELPDYLIRYEMVIRSLRSSLPETRFNASDKEYFEERFTDFIDQCQPTMDSSQNFHAQVTRTIGSHEIETLVIVNRLNDHILFPQAKPTEPDSLAKIIAWFRNHNLIWLPASVEIPQEYSYQQFNTSAFQALEQYLDSTALQLIIGINLVLELQRKLNGLWSTLEEIGSKLTKCKAEAGYRNYIEDEKWLPWLRRMFATPTYNSRKDLQLVQPVKWTDNIKPFFKEALGFTTAAVDCLQEAYKNSQELKQQLKIEERAEKYGPSTEWMKLQAQNLNEGLAELGAQFRAIRLEYLHFSRLSRKHAFGL